MTRKTLIVGNWKMHKTISETKEFFASFDSPLNENIYFAVPHTSIAIAAECAPKNSIVGAQNMNDHEKGAFTGEISSAMILDAGGKFVILGHSERRHVFHESSAFVNRKVKRALEDGLMPIVCIGETAEERGRDGVQEVLYQQLEESLAGISSQQAANLVVAYEPVWAIGKGIAAEPDEVEEVHQFVRKVLNKFFGEEVASKVPVLYGGSVNAMNAKEFMSESDIDGLLVGGASLEPDSFATIIKSIQQYMVKQ